MALPRRPFAIVVGFAAGGLIAASDFHDDPVASLIVGAIVWVLLTLAILGFYRFADKADKNPSNNH